MIPSRTNDLFRFSVSPPHANVDLGSRKRRALNSFSTYSVED